MAANIAFISSLVFSIILLIAATALSTTSAVKANENDVAGAYKYAWYTALTTGLAVGVLIAILVAYFYRGNIAEAGQNVLQKLKSD